MAIKKSELYSSLWASCDQLRGGMDASQYKDYVLVLLFVKYVSDKYENDPDAVTIIPKGGSFKDMVALKNDKNIGDQINKIIGVLAKANDWEGVITVADFNDDEKLGKGKEMVDKLTNLIAIFENPALDFSKNRADGDDILGDAYEYLMRHFATESGKSKGQFYTPSEVSRVVAKVLGIQNASNQTTFYDPTCGSGSLLLKALDEADGKGSIYGQEKDVTTAALARMNMILHGQEAIEIHKGQSTLSDPFFKDEHGFLKMFDFVVANPPFSLKNWATGFNPQDDLFGRFDMGATPPDKNGDFAFLLHILKSLKNTGQGACILPHGVLFRGNAEAEIRKNLILRGFIKGIIGLPTNLFYGTGIPACIIVLDKADAALRTQKGIFMMDASKGFIKDGNKNRLREQDIHKIVDVFKLQLEEPKFSRLVPFAEIADPKNDFNLNIPRYIDAQEAEDLQDIEAHLLGGIPTRDIEALQSYWTVCPDLKNHLFLTGRDGFLNLAFPTELLKTEIFAHPQFARFCTSMDALFEGWKSRNALILKDLQIGVKPKTIIARLADDILSTYADKPLMDRYDVYQHLMNFWHEAMQDDCYGIAADGWKAIPARILVKNKGGKDTDKGWECDLVPKYLVINRFFAAEQAEITRLEAEKDALIAQIAELEEEHQTEDGFFADFDKVNRNTVFKRLKTIDAPMFQSGHADEIKVLKAYLQSVDQLADTTKKMKDATTTLDAKVLNRYKTLSEPAIKQLVVDDKWMASLERRVQSEMQRISQRLTQRIHELAERYQNTLPQLATEVAAMENKVFDHLRNMGFVWN